MFITELKVRYYQIELKDKIKMHPTCIKNTFKVSIYSIIKIIVINLYELRTYTRSKKYNKNKIYINMYK